MLAQQIAAGVFVAMLIIIGTYDLVVMIFYPDVPSVSLIIYTWGTKFPALYLLVGLALGHLVFPLKIKVPGP